MSYQQPRGGGGGRGFRGGGDRGRGGGGGDRGRGGGGGQYGDRGGGGDRGRGGHYGDRGGSGGYRGDRGGGGQSRGGPSSYGPRNFPSGDQRDSRGGYRGAPRGRGNDGQYIQSRSSGPQSGQSPHGGQQQSMPKGEPCKQLIKQQLPPGTVARETVNLVANFYYFTMPDVKVYHYDVDIKRSRKATTGKGAEAKKSKTQSATVEDEIASLELEQKPSGSSGAIPKDDSSIAAPLEPEQKFIKKFAVEIFDQFQAQNSDLFTGVQPIYDGYKSLYTIPALKLPATPFKPVKVNIEGKESFFIVRLRKVDENDLSEVSEFFRGTVSDISEHTNSVIEIIFRCLFRQAGYAMHQRKSFDLTTAESPQYPQFKIHQFVRGCMNAVRMTEFGLALNVHLKTTCIISRLYERLDELVAKLAELQRGPAELASTKLKQFQINKINSMLRHVQFKTVHNNITYKFYALQLKTPKESEFFLTEEKRKVSHHEYFAKRYKETFDKEGLKNYPMVQTTKGSVIVPLDWCIIKPDQFLSHKKINDDDDIQRELLAKSTHSPNVYFNHAGNIVRKVIAAASPGFQQATGIKSISQSPVALKGRVLPAPAQIGAGMNDKLNKPLPPTVWAFISFDNRNRDDESHEFVARMRDASRAKGLNLNEPRLIRYFQLRGFADLEDICSDLYNDPNLKNMQLLMCALPNYHPVCGKEIYEQVKYFFDHHYGIITQCVNGEKMSKTLGPTNFGFGYFDRLLYKLNGKIGGQNAMIESRELNSIVKVKPGRTMIVGVDVYHPGATDVISSSIAAAIGSYDDKWTKYAASLSVQKKDFADKDREMIKQIGTMFEELLKHYKDVNRTYPEYVFVFRDGVSEGQLDKLKSIEIPAIEKAMVKCIGKKIPLTLMVVQKRHHTRFAREQPIAKGRDREGNPRLVFCVAAGTVVDQTITDPRHAEFYLASHESPLGTTKPSKYIRIRDDIKLTTDELQKLCFFACHQCIRTRDSISIPTPVRYADLAAYRAGLHLKASNALASAPERAGHSSDASEVEQRIISELNREVKVNEHIQKMLYYC